MFICTKFLHFLDVYCYMLVVFVYKNQKKKLNRQKKKKEQSNSTPFFNRITSFRKNTTNFVLWLITPPPFVLTLRYKLMKELMNEWMAANYKNRNGNKYAQHFIVRGVKRQCKRKKKDVIINKFRLTYKSTYKYTKLKKKTILSICASRVDRVG